MGARKEDDKNEVVDTILKLESAVLSIFITDRLSLHIACASLEIIIFPAAARCSPLVI